MWFAGFFFTSMLSLCGLMGDLSTPSEELYGWTTGSGKSFAGAPAGIMSPAFFPLHHH
jgi:hypothetical protein